MSVKNQEIERIYIEQVRDIETAFYVLNERKRNALNDINRLRTPYRKPDFPSKPSFPFLNYFSLLVIILILAVVCYILYLFLRGILGNLLFWWTDNYQTLGAIISILAFVAAVFFISCVTINDMSEYGERKKAYKENLLMHIEKLEQIKIKEQSNYKRSCELEKLVKNYKVEIKQAEEIKNKLYGINWIPIQYRDIRVIYYICDMVTTADISIDEALKFYLMQEANDKLDEVIRKLDKIIDNQKEIILNQAILQSQNKELISQNKKMINKLASIEDNTKLAADYASVCAGYSEITAFVSMASYLEK